MHYELGIRPQCCTLVNNLMTIFVIKIQAREGMWSQTFTPYPSALANDDIWVPIKD